MAKPVIFTVDDDPSVLNSVERDLRSHYGQAYRILSHQFGAGCIGLFEEARTTQRDRRAVFS